MPHARGVFLGKFESKKSPSSSSLLTLLYVSSSLYKKTLSLTYYGPSDSHGHGSKYQARDRT